MATNSDWQSRASVAQARRTPSRLLPLLSISLVLLVLYGVVAATSLLTTAVRLGLLVAIPLMLGLLLLLIGAELRPLLLELERRRPGQPL